MRSSLRPVLPLLSVILLATQFVWVGGKPATAAASPHVLFEDGFEGGYGSWSRVIANGGWAYTSRLAAHAGTWGVRLGATRTAGSIAYVRRMFPEDYRELNTAVTVRVRPEVLTGRAFPILHMLTRAGTGVLSLYRSASGPGRLLVRYGGSFHTTSARLPGNTWARIAIHMTASGTSGAILVTFNGRRVFSGHSADLGTVVFAGIQLGSADYAQPFALDADEVDVTSPAPAPCGTLQARIDAAPVGSVLDLTGCTYTTGGIVSKPLTIRGASVMVPGGMVGLAVNADGVTLDGLQITGQQATTFDDGAYGVLAQARSASAPISHLTIRNCEIASFGGYGIYLRYVVNPLVLDNRVHDIVYAGIKVDSGRHGRIQGNTVQRIGVVGSEANSRNAYGIVLEQVVYGDLATNPLTADFVVSGNTVEDVPTWHGLDTHAGQRITFSNNTVRRTMRALFITTHNDGYRPRDIIVTGNQFLSPAPITENLAAVSLYRADRVIITDNTFVGWPAGREIIDYTNESTDVVSANNTVLPG